LGRNRAKTLRDLPEDFSMIFNRRGLVILALSLLLFATLITSAQIDLTEPSMFFYVSRLSPLWYLATFLTLVATMKANDRLVKIFASILLIYLVYGLPSYILMNPRVNDQYPFMTEPLYVELYGHLGNAHYLLQSPGLGLYFSQLTMITGMNLKYLEDIRALSDFFAYMNPLTLALSTATIPRLLGKSDKWIYVMILVPLLSIMYPIDIFHRQTFSLNYLPLYFYGLLKNDFVILALASVAMVLSHPGTPLFTWIALITALILAYALNVNRKDHGYTATMLTGLVILAIFWFAYHMITTQSILNTIVGAVRGFISDILGGEVRLMAVEKLAMGVTREFRIVVLVPRLLIASLYLMIFWLMALVVLWNKRSSSALKLLTLIHAGYVPQVIPFIYWGTLNIRSLLFVLYSSVPLVPLYFDILGSPTLSGSSKRDMWKSILTYLTKLMPAFKKVLDGLIIVAVILTPILTFSTIPYLHSSTSEILAQKFIECEYVGSTARSPPIIVTEYPVWIFDVVCGNKETKLGEAIIDSSATIKMLSNGEASGILIVGRLVAREAFYAPTGLLYGSGVETQREFVIKVSGYASINLSRVYDSSYEVEGDFLLGVVVLYLKT